MRQRILFSLVCSTFLLLTVTAACAPQTPIETTPSPAPQAAVFEVGPITVEPPVVMVGDTAAVTAAITNTGNIAGTYNAAFLIDDKEAGSQITTVDVGNSQEVTFQFSKPTAGKYKVAIGNSNMLLTVYNWKPYTIQYDNFDEAPGNMYRNYDLAGIYVSGDEGHIVRFTPVNKAFKVQKIRVLGTVRILNTSDFDRNYVTFNIWSKEGTRLWSQGIPWRLFEGGAIWREIPVPDIRVNDDFYVELVTHSSPAVYRSDGTVVYGGDPIDFVQLASAANPFTTVSPLAGLLNIVVIGFDYPQSYIDAPLNRPETRSGYSLNGKLFEPGQGRLEGIQWLIRVEGEGAPGN
jgi:hypothetical protein